MATFTSAVRPRALGRAWFGTTRRPVAVRPQHLRALRLELTRRMRPRRLMRTGCESGTRTLVTVTINALPGAPSAGNVIGCFDGVVHTGSATAGAGESVVWYTAATGGSTTTAPSGTGVGTYTAYATAKIDTTDARVRRAQPVTVTINALPGAPSAGNVIACFDGKRSQPAVRPRAPGRAWSGTPPRPVQCDHSTIRHWSWNLHCVRGRQE
jgi:hypothetical protein